ncbi:hypothetical protein PspLS_06909 [Pyricularia sp. CBS 133598]|nr:hypothetical protein PspLS_06909 [Pyricularia sp. CBS 133598]
MGAALPSITTSDAAALNTRAEPIRCSSAGVCISARDCKATINGQVQVFQDLSCTSFPNPPSKGPQGPPGGSDSKQRKSSNTIKSVVDDTV